MDLNLPLIFVGLVFSGAGWVYFSYGRRLAKLELIVCGLSLMIYPYFVSTVPWSLAVGAVLSALPFIFRWW